MKKVVMILCLMFSSLVLISCNDKINIETYFLDNIALDIQKETTSEEVVITFPVKQSFKVKEKEYGVTFTWTCEEEQIQIIDNKVTLLKEQSEYSVSFKGKLNNTTKEVKYVVDVEKKIPVKVGDYTISWTENAPVSELDISFNGVIIEKIPTANKFDLSTHIDKLHDAKTLIEVSYLDGETTIYLFQKLVEYIEHNVNYSIDFEKDVSKGGYGNATINYNQITWQLNQALIGGGEGNDQKNGLKNLRFRENAEIYNHEEIKDITNISFYYGTYGSDAQSLKIEVKKTGTDNWLLVNETLAMTSDFMKHTIDLTKIDPELKNGVSVRFTALGAKGRGCLDDISFLSPADEGKLVIEDYTSDLEHMKEKHQVARNAFLATKVTGNENFDAAVYYQNIVETSVTLKNDLNVLLNKDFRGTTYGNARYLLELSDVTNSGSDQLRLMYTDGQFPNIWDEGKNWEREHVWPNSRLEVENTRPGNDEASLKSDSHNLRAINGTINRERSNNFFDVVTAPGYYFPGELDKGDTARILFYMYVMYPTLTLTEETEETTKMSMGKLSMLLRWHNEDPVDEFELGRNQVIYEFQNNRNPFIDKSTLLEKVYNIAMTKYLNSYINPFAMQFDLGNLRKRVELLVK